MVKFMGLEKLTNAFGISTLAMGLAALVGNPVGAALKQSTGSYTLPFIWFGIINLMGGLMWLILPWVYNWENRKNTQIKI